MTVKRTAAVLLLCALLLQAAVFADEPAAQEEEGSVYPVLLGMEEMFYSGELSLKNGAGESEEPEIYLRDSDEKNAREIPGVFVTEAPEPGWHIIKGHVVYVKEDGSFARNESVNGRDFNIVGSYTTGDGEFDAMLAWIFVTTGIDKYEFGSDEQLHELFRWEVNNMGYRKNDFIDPGTHGWELERGKALLLEGKGNCYMFAGLFYELSRAIGYEPVAYSGTISTEKRPHGWVEIEFDGTPYIFDTEICYQQIYFEKNYNANFYKQTSEQLRGWYYIKAEEDMPETTEQG